MKKEIMKKMPMFLASMLMVFVFTVLCSASSVEAAAVKEYELKKTITKLYLDVNGDKKNETLTFQSTRTYGYVDKTIVKVNNKKALVLDFKNDPSIYDPHTIEVRYIPISSKVKLIGIHGICDGNMTGVNRVYRYDSKKKAFVQVLDLVTEYSTYADVTKTTTKGFYVEYSAKPSETGRISWSLFYNYRNNKATLKSQYAKVKSRLGLYNIPKWDPYYTKLFKQNKFKTYKPLKYTTTSTGTKTAFTTKRGNIVTLKYIRFTKDKIYLQFQKGSKRGWLTLTKKRYPWDNERDWFYDVSNRAAG